MIGLGYHATITPAVIRRNVLEDPSWYTAYTPYQPEISQGRLEALLNFQTVIGDLTGLPTANASLLDEGTAAAEAMTLVRRGEAHRDRPVRRRRRRAAADDRGASAPAPRRWASSVVVADLTDGLPDGDLSGVLVQYPGASGRILDPRPLIDAVHERGALAVVAADLLALTLLESPGELGADVVVGSSQRFGVPMFYGGPHAGFMSVAAGLERHLPGRLVGVSVDAEGRPAYRLALQTREQHIRRDKATSNICTAQVLLAVVASMYAVYHGPEGLRGIAERIHGYAGRIAPRCCDDGGSRSSTTSSSTRSRCARRVAPRNRRRGSRAGRAPAPGRRRPRRTLHVGGDHDIDGDHGAARVRSRARAETAADARGRVGARGPASHHAVPHPRGVLAPTAARPRCCATCARCRRATTPSTAG